MCLTVTSAEAWGLQSSTPHHFYASPHWYGIADIIMPHGRDQQGLTRCATSLEATAAPGLPRLSWYQKPQQTTIAVPRAGHLRASAWLPVWWPSLTHVCVARADLLKPRPPPRQ